MGLTLDKFRYTKQAHITQEREMDELLSQTFQRCPTESFNLLIARSEFSRRLQEHVYTSSLRQLPGKIRYEADELVNIDKYITERLNTLRKETVTFTEKTLSSDRCTYIRDIIKMINKKGSFASQGLSTKFCE